MDAFDGAPTKIIATDIETCSRIIQGLLAAPKQIVTKTYENYRLLENSETIYSLITWQSYKHGNEKQAKKSIMGNGCSKRKCSGLWTALRDKCPYSEFFWSECGKIRTTKTPNTDTFHAVLLTEKAFSNAKTFQYPVTVLPLSLANTDSSLRQQKRS